MAEQQKTNMYGLYEDGLKGVAEFFRKHNAYEAISIPEALNVLSKGAVSSVELYDAWLEGLHDLTHEYFAICRNLADGKKTDATNILKVSEQISENMTERMIKAVEDTPYAWMKPVMTSLKDSTDLRNNGHIMKAMLQSGIDMSASMIGMSKSSFEKMSDIRNSPMTQSA